MAQQCCWCRYYQELRDDVSTKAERRRSEHARGETELLPLGNETEVSVTDTTVQAVEMETRSDEGQGTNQGTRIENWRVVTR